MKKWLILFSIFCLFSLPDILAESPPGEAWYYSNCPPKAVFYLNLSDYNISAEEWELTFYMVPTSYSGSSGNLTEFPNITVLKNFESVEEEYLRDPGRWTSFRQIITKSKGGSVVYYFNESPDGRFKFFDTSVPKNNIIVTLENKKTKEIYFSNLTNLSYDYNNIKWSSNNYYSYELVIKKLSLYNNSMLVEFWGVLPRYYECTQKIFFTFNITNLTLDQWDICIIPLTKNLETNFVPDYERIRAEYSRIKEECGQGIVYDKPDDGELINFSTLRISPFCVDNEMYFYRECYRKKCDCQGVNETSCSNSCISLYECSAYPTFEKYIRNSGTYIYMIDKLNTYVNRLNSNSSAYIVLEKINSSEVYFSDLVTLDLEKCGPIDWSSGYFSFGLNISFGLNSKENRLILDLQPADNLTYWTESCPEDSGDGSTCTPPPMPEGYLGVPSNRQKKIYAGIAYAFIIGLIFLFVIVVLLFILGLVFLIRFIKRRKSK